MGGAQSGSPKGLRKKNPKHYVSHRSVGLEAGGLGSRKSECPAGSEAASELGYPGCPPSGGCARTSGAGAVARSAAPNAGLDFPGSRRGSLRRAGAREPRSEVVEAGAQASGSSWSSPFFSGSAPPAAGPAAPGHIDMAAVLQQVLERTELNKLPKSVQNKLEKFLADQQSEIDGLKGRHEKFKVESGKWRRSSRPWFWARPRSHGWSSPLASSLSAYDFADGIASLCCLALL